MGRKRGKSTRREARPGCVAYWRKGKLHRSNGPAVISDDHKQWWINGKLHRKNGPACVFSNREVWYLNGLIHRENDLPAEIRSLVSYWFRHGYWHRLTGPAVEYTNGLSVYYIYNKIYMKEEFDKVINTMKRLIRNIKMRRFVKLCRSEAFCRVFYAEGQMGRKWDNAKIEKFSNSL